MIDAVRDGIETSVEDDEVGAIVLTGADPYYCAGVNLSDTIKLMHPAKLRDGIVHTNAAIFDMFLDCTKPIVAAVNGPAIGASVTTATLCDAIVASDRATFNTPFHALGLVPEGCSSVHFAHLMGEEAANRMLGAEGWCVIDSTRVCERVRFASCAHVCVCFVVCLIVEFCLRLCCMEIGRGLCSSALVLSFLVRVS